MQNVVPIRIRLATGWLLLVLFGFGISPARAGETDIFTWIGRDRATLPVVVRLASDVEPRDEEQFNLALDALSQELSRQGDEFAAAAFAVYEYSDPDFTTLAAPETDGTADEIEAMGSSLARLRGAEEAGRNEWSGQQERAARHYAAQAAQKLLRSAESAEQQSANMESLPFAVRRSPASAESVLKQIGREGLPAADRELLAVAFDDKEIDAYQAELIATPSNKIGRSIVEYYDMIADARRRLAATLEQIASAETVYSSEGSDPFLVANPTDAEATIDLYVRRASIPPQWELSIVDARQTTGNEQSAEPQVQEVKAGEHYRVRLPAGGSTRVKSVVVPIGALGQNTTARWAVEGKIGDELIGGMMHEMHVPAVAADPELPPVAIAPVAVDTTAPSGRVAMLLIVGALVASVLLAVILVLRIRKTKGGAS